MKTTLNLLLFLFAFLSTSCQETSKAEQSQFVTVKDGQFIKNGEPYYYVGANFWYGGILGSKGEGGDRERLLRELDDLKSHGVTNLRVAVGGEGETTYASKITPILQPNPGEYNQELLDGLDYFMAELSKRDMQAVLYLANAWEWSGSISYVDR